MSMRRLCFLILFTFLLAMLAWIPTNSQVPERNVNMVEGQTLPGGDPWLQRQNEPSMAVSTRNPFHLLAGANDYRTVEMPIPGEELPGIPEGAAAGDAWLGVFKSFDGGESWMSTLLPGYPQDISYDGTSSPLFGFQAAADPTVRAGANGLFYYSGIAFNREEHGRSVVFVARYIDNNDIEDPDPENDPIEYIDAKIIDEGTSGQFADKPWVAVDKPRNNGTVQIDEQSIPRHNVYIVYSLFLGDLAQNVHNKILFARSTDCGNTWEHPIKLSESQRINQGTTLAVDPSNGHIYVAWRRFASEGESDAIMFCKSTDGGQKFSKASVAAEINPFDQGTTGTSFRTNAYPTIAVDDSSNVYLAWSERDAGLEENAGADARIVIITGHRGKNWSGQKLVDDYDDRGHQIMPSLTFAAGKLMMAWYDFREDVAGNTCDHWEDYVSDDHAAFCDWRHTVDVRLAQADPQRNPVFDSSVQVSRYYWIMENDGTCYQAQFNPPNYPLFKQGTVPFIGDYIDICPSPRFVMKNGVWQFNTGSEDPAIFHVTWTDNRDVRPPPDGDWTLYNPPNSSQPGFPAPGSCIYANRTGMRNQNVYTSRIVPGIEVGSFGNTKSLDIQRAFVICVKNTNEVIKYFKLIIPEQPQYGQASFYQSGEVVDFLPVNIAPHSSISRPVFVQSSDPDESVIIEVKETDENGEIIANGLQSFIVLNPDPTNPEVDPGDETHDPIVDSTPIEVNLVNANLVNANLVNENIPNANLVNANLVNFNFTNVNLVNANLVNANLVNPSIYDSVNLVNANLVNSSVSDPDVVTDVQWTVKNDGNTTSSYTFRSVAPESLPEGLYAQLIIYQAHTTPGTDGANCALKEVPHHAVLVNLVNPHIIDPNIEDVNLVNPDLGNSAIENATFALPPKEEAIITLRIISNSSSGLSAAEAIRAAQQFTQSVGVGVTSHAPNTATGTISVSTTQLKVFTLSLPDGLVGVQYPPDSEIPEAYIKAFGGKGPYTWDYSGAWPPGLTFEPVIDPDPWGNSDTVKIHGVPTVEGEYSFEVQVWDSSTPDQQHATQPLTITILPSGIFISGTVSFGGSGLEGVTMEVEGLSGDTIITDENGEYSFKVDLGWTGTVAPSLEEYLFYPPSRTYSSVSVNQTGEDYAAYTEDWVRRYNNDAVNGDEEASAIAADNDKAWVTGYSTGKTTGEDYATVMYDSSGNEGWITRYDGPSHEGDFATSMAAYNDNVYVTGYSYRGVPVKHADYYTVKYDSSGDVVWEEKYDSRRNGNDVATAIAVDSSGVYVTGRSEESLGSGEKDHDFYTAMYAISNGKKIWDNRYDGPADGADEATAIAVDSSGNVYVTGRSEGSGTGFDYCTVMYDSAGIEKWVATYNGPASGDDEATGVAVDTSGNVYVTGKSLGNGTGFDYCTVMYDSTGNERWAVRYNGPGDNEDVATAIAVNSLGVYVTGRSKGSGTGFDYCTIMYDLGENGGSEQWVERYNYDDSINGHDEAVAMVIDSTGIYVTGRSEGDGTSYDYTTVKYDFDGSVILVVRYETSGDDEATAIAVESRNIYITGISPGSGTAKDYVTVKYRH